MGKPKLYINEWFKEIISYHETGGVIHKSLQLTEPQLYHVGCNKHLHEIINIKKERDLQNKYEVSFSTIIGVKNKVLLMMSV